MVNPCRMGITQSNQTQCKVVGPALLPGAQPLSQSGRLKQSQALKATGACKEVEKVELSSADVASWGTAQLPAACLSGQSFMQPLPADDCMNAAWMHASLMHRQGPPKIQQHGGA